MENAKAKAEFICSEMTTAYKEFIADLDNSASLMGAVAYAYGRDSGGAETPEKEESRRQVRATLTRRIGALSKFYDEYISPIFDCPDK